jgi:tRNA(Leu) C34 or U34 (ribose-2'-O)-methylase TrmL
MVVVASMWEYGWNTPIKEFDLWHYPLKDFGVDEFAMTPVSGIRLNNKVQEFHSVEDIIKHYGLPVILCTEHGEYTLEEFEHPENALYLFNRTSGGIIVEKPDYSLRIETKQNKGMLWGHQAASIILYDRFKKWQ